MANRLKANAPLLAALALTLVAYGGSLAATRAFDDYHSVFENELLRDAGNIPAFFTDRDTFSVEGSSHYRPLVVTSYALTFATFGDSLPAFHAVNLLVHLGCVAFLFLLLAGLLRGGEAARSDWIAAVGAAAFGVHPAASQVVHYISSRSESMAMLGILAAMAAHAASLDPSRSRRRRIALHAACALAVAFALGSKETGVLALPLLVAVDLVLDPGGWSSLSHRAKRLAVPALLVGAYFAVLLLPSVVGAWSKTPDLSILAVQATDPGAAVEPAWVLRLRANWTYALLVVFPHDLAVWHELPAAASPYLQAIGAAALLGGATIASGVLLLTRRRRRLGLVIAMIAVPLLPYVVRGLNVIVHEGRLYPTLAGVGAAVAFAIAGPVRNWCARGEFRRRTAIVVAVALCAAAIGRDWKSSYTWASEIRLWRASLDAAPRSGNMHAGLGTALMREKRFEEARAYFERALELGVGQRFVVYDNLGRLAYHAGDKPLALRYFEQAYESNPNDIAVLTNLGILLDEMGRPHESLPLLDRSIELSSGYCEPHVYALRVTKELGLRDQAAARLRALPRHCSGPVIDEVRAWAGQVAPR